MSTTETPQGSHIWLVQNEELYEDGWYFSDETENFNGPFPSIESAQKELADYCLWLDKGPIAEVLDIPCDLSYVTAKKACEDFERITGKTATHLYCTPIDETLARELAEGSGLTVQLASNFREDTWSVGDDRHFGVGSVGA